MILNDTFKNLGIHPIESNTVFDPTTSTNDLGGVQAPRTTDDEVKKSPWHIPEILAPVGGRDQFFAALNAGADAVFLGLKSFNARARAENFTIEELTALVPLAHHFDMKVLVTLNILIKTDEIPSIIATLAALENINVDAIIVQDLGLFHLAKRFFPSLRVHASTQLAIHNLEGVQAAAELGFKRVVVAREMTATELRRIRREIPRETIEIEAFCHGSLCYSYSGLCFFSGANDARSGNRGECAYTCRKPYKVLNEPGHGFLFSMRDLDISKDIDLYLSAGIDTLKIEGRKKDAQYVANVVRLYRKMLDQAFGYSTLRAQAPRPTQKDFTEAELRTQLSLSFQRQGTSFFVKGRYHENVIDLDNPTHVGQLVGKIEQVKDRHILVTTQVPLDRFDGLKIVPQGPVFHAKPQHGSVIKRSVADARRKYQNEGTQFSLRSMRNSTKQVTSVEASTSIWIELPPQAESPQVDDLLYKTRSDAVRQMTEQDIKVPEGFRLRPLIPIETEIHAYKQDGEIILHITLSRAQRQLVIERYSFPLTIAANFSRVQDSLQNIFGIWGDAGFASSVSLRGDVDWYVSDKQLKDIKRQLGTKLIEANIKVSQDAVTQAMASIKNESAKISAKSVNQCSFTIKIDRPEYFDVLAKYLRANPTFPLHEVIFEPKKAFLGPTSMDDVKTIIANFQSNFDISVRMAIPTVLREWDKPLLRRWLNCLGSQVNHRFEIGNLGGLNFIKKNNGDGIIYDLTGDFTLYALNPSAAGFIHSLGIKKLAFSIEDDCDNITANLTAGIWHENLTPQVILYKDTPLFIAESCSLTALHNGCPTASVCGYRTLHIENAEGERFYVGHESCKSIVYGESPFSITEHRDRLLTMGIQDFRIDFLTRFYESPAIHQVLNAAFQSSKLPHGHTANFMGRLL